MTESIYSRALKITKEIKDSPSAQQFDLVEEEFGTGGGTISGMLKAATKALAAEETSLNEQIASLLE